MKQITKIDKSKLNQICRCCLTEIQKTDVAIPNLSQLLHELFLIKIKPDLPENICKICTDDITRVSEFRRKVLESDEALTAVISLDENNDFSVESCQQEDTINNEAADDNVEVFKIEVSEQEIENRDGNEYELLPSPKNNELEETELVKDTHEKGISKTPKIYNCSCGQTFHDYKTYVDHRKQIKHPKKARRPYPCMYCGKMINSSTMKRHYLKHTKEKPFICETCGISFISDTNLKRHQYHHATERLVCEVCKKTFTYPETLKLHMRSHTTEDPFFCSSCGKGFQEQESYEEHKRTKHKRKRPSEPKKIQAGSHNCEICNKVYSSPFALRSHLLTHKTKKFLCTVCGKGFYSKTHLNIHYRVHSGEKPFSCEICKKGFSQQHSLQRHVLIHTGEKPHVCEICEKSFTQTTHLKAHMVVHTGEKLYTCPLCEKQYRQYTSLLVHRRSHTGETPYNCDQCGRGFHHSTAMKKHRATHFKNNKSPMGDNTGNESDKVKEEDH